MTREEGFFGPKKTAEEKKAEAKVKAGGMPLSDPSLPDNVNKAYAAFNAAHQALKDNHYQEGIALFKKACALDPIRKIYWAALGSAYGNNIDWESACAAYREVYKRDVYDVFNLTSLGYASEASRKDEDARRYYLMALTVQPDLRDAWQELFNIMHGMGTDRFYQSVQAMMNAPASIDNVDLIYKINQAVLDENPDEYYCLVNRAMLRIRLLRLDEAQLDVTHALKLQPLGPGAMLAQADIYNKSGQVEKAMAAYRLLLQTSPQPVAYAQLGELEMQKGQIDQALHDYGKATELGNDKPSWIDTYNKLRDLRNKRIDDAALKVREADLKKAEQKLPSAPDKSGVK